MPSKTMNIIMWFILLRVDDRVHSIITPLSTLCSYPPFFDEHPFRIYEKILEGKIEWPRVVNSNAKDLIKRLLVRDWTRRLGGLKVITLHVGVH